MVNRGSKGSSHNRVSDCPSCRRKGPGGGKDDKSSGGASKGSTSATAGSSVAVGA